MTLPWLRRLGRRCLSPVTPAPSPVAPCCLGTGLPMNACPRLQPSKAEGEPCSGQVDCIVLISFLRCSRSAQACPAENSHGSPSNKKSPWL